ncbi:MAG: DUF975 family protein [Clostridia bacterium]|nr:DUF975 family protein [Clostridia bacterium]
MHFSKDFRAIARKALAGNYWIAVLVCLVARVLGGITATGTSFGSGVRYTAELDSALQGLLATPAGRQLGFLLLGFFVSTGAFLLVQLLIGGALHIGLCRYNLGVTDGKKENFSTLFTGFDIFGKALGLRCFVMLFQFLWSLLLVVPGIIAALRYSMATYIMAEHPEIGIREAVDRSKRMMHGNKWRLFKLYLSFVGWFLLSALTCGVGFVFLAPYIRASEAAFYLEVSGQNYRISQYK